MTTDIQNLKSFDPFAEADDTGGESKTSQQNYIHIRIQRKCPQLRSFRKRF
jgi:translation initiation factor 1